MSDRITTLFEKARFVVALLVTVGGIVGTACVAFYRLSAVEQRADRMDTSIGNLSQLRQGDHDLIISLTNQLGQIAKDVGNIWKKVQKP